MPQRFDSPLQRGSVSPDQLSVRTLLRCAYSPRVQSYSLPSVRTLKISRISVCTIVWRFENTAHTRSTLEDGAWRGGGKKVCYRSMGRLIPVAATQSSRIIFSVFDFLLSPLPCRCRAAAAPLPHHRYEIVPLTVSSSVQFGSDPLPIGSSAEHDGRCSRDPLSVYSCV